MVVGSINCDKSNKSTCVAFRDDVNNTSHWRCLLLQRHLVQSLRPTRQRGRRGQWPRQWPSWRWCLWRMSPKPQPHSRSHSSQSLNLLSLKVNVVVSCSYHVVSHLDWSCENYTQFTSNYRFSNLRNHCFKFWCKKVCVSLVTNYILTRH